VQSVFKSVNQTKSATRPNLSPTQPNAQPAPDPWETKPRLNILLLGGDAGKGRVGTRTDTIIVASIDTRTGNTTMFSLPRNTAKMPFPKDSPLHKYYPNGYYNGDSQDAEHFLNSMYGNLPENVPKDVLGPTDNLGADALKLSVGEALGLKIDYYVLVNLRGFQTLVDALGGIRVNVNSYVPIGGVSEEDRHVLPSGYIEPGPNRHLDGRLALWFARGRYGSDDFVRMGRQRCVINAIIQQANPANLLARYEKIAKAGKQIVITDIPQEVLPLLVQLSLRVKNGQTRSVLFQQGTANFRSFDPDFPEMRRRVKQAIEENERTAPAAKPSQSGSASPSASPSAKSNKKKKKKKKASPSATPSASSKSDPLDDTCAFDPKKAAEATRPN
jgi:LCP family protein required for cell wall assembly